MTEQPDNPAGQVDGRPPAPAGQLDGTPVNIDGSLSVQEAAAHFGVSERTIRRRIKDGSLNASKLPTTQGYEWRVHLDGATVQLDGVSARQSVNVDGSNVHLAGNPSAPAQEEPPTSPATTGPELRLALEHAEQLRRDNAALVARNEQLAGQLGFVQAKLQEAEKTIALLMAPKDEPEPEEPPAEPVRVSWWKRLWGG